MIKALYIIGIPIACGIAEAIILFTGLRVSTWLEKKDQPLIRQMWEDGHKDFYSTFRAKFHGFINLFFLIAMAVVFIAALIAGGYVIDNL